jgi:[ribosomal protein S5]-alanine N-acetyltransferase
MNLTDQSVPGLLPMESRTMLEDSPSELCLSWKTPRMILRPFSEQDRAEFVRVYAISRTLFEPWMPATLWDQPLDQLFDRQLERCLAGLREGNQVKLVGLGDDHRIAGFFSLSEIVRGVFQNAYASWSVSADQAGTGLGTEGVQALLDFAFSPAPQGLGLHRVQANVIPGNRASIRVAEKVGFRYEGMAKGYLKIAGQWQDHAMYAKLADEHNIRHPERCPS